MSASTAREERVRLGSRLIVAWGVFRWALEVAGGSFRFLGFLFTRNRIRADIRRRIESVDPKRSAHDGPEGTL